jgi:hypothetical protein
LVNARNTYAIITVSTLDALVALLTLITLNTGWALLTVVTSRSLRALNTLLTLRAALTLWPGNLFNVTYLSPRYFGANKIQDLN